MGEDFPLQYRELFEARGVDVRGLETAVGRTFRWKGEYMAELGHAHTLETQLNVFSTFHPKLETRHRECPLVFLANIDPDLQLEVLDQMKRPRLVLSDTMNYWIARKPERVVEVLRRVDVALLNEEEARALSGETQLAAAADRLIEQGGVRIDGEKVADKSLTLARGKRIVVQVGPITGCSGQSTVATLTR